MASSLAKIDIHIIFHVKIKGTMILPEDLNRLFAYIGGIINRLDGIPIEIGGMPDHLHILASLPKNMSLADFTRTIKAESSKWIKSLNAYYGGFSWQSGYGAFSVSPSLLGKSVNYIRNQKVHHQKRTFAEEYKMFLEAYGIEYDERYAFSD